MTLPPLPWPRPHFESSGAIIRFDLYCFSEQPITLDADSPAADPWCPYSKIPESIDLGVYARRDAAVLFEKILGTTSQPPLGRATLQMSGFEALRDRWAHAYCVEVSLTDPADLGHLQCAWAMARWLVRHGAAGPYDDAARRWHLSNPISSWPTPLPFSIDREIQVVFETDHDPGRGHAMHTRGMRKFGRPDLLLELPPGHGLRWQMERGNRDLIAVAHELALGKVLSPGRTIGVNDAHFSVEPYRPGENYADIPLENDGRVLTRR